MGGTLDGSSNPSLLPIPILHNYQHPPLPPGPPSATSGGSSGSGTGGTGGEAAATIVRLVPSPAEQQLPMMDLNLFNGLPPMHSVYSMHSRFGE